MNRIFLKAISKCVCVYLSIYIYTYICRYIYRYTYRYNYYCYLLCKKKIIATMITTIAIIEWWIHARHCLRICMDLTHLNSLTGTLIVLIVGMKSGVRLSSPKADFLHYPPRHHWGCLRQILGQVPNGQSKLALGRIVQPRR